MSFLGKWQTSNAQRPTSNVEIQSLHSRLDVEGWPFDVFFNNVDPDSIPSFRRALLAWYRKNGRDLPWRRTTDPYAILVSELMLQQTQVAAVVPYYHNWMQRFPDFAALAVASEQEVLHAWQGLGYYNRARNLRAAAQRIVQEGRFPRSLERIGELPGVGRYTTRAIATFAFNRSVPIVEANIGRLLARLLDLQIPIDSSRGRDRLWQVAAELVPDRAAATYNSALMDLGALICCARPKCAICPVEKFCRAADPSRLPIKRARRTTKFCTEHHSFTQRRDRVLLEQSNGRWRGMWILPRLAAPPSSRQALHLSEFPFTHHRITLAVHSRKKAAAGNLALKWFPISDLASVPLPSPHRRALDAILQRA
jgi:A/G-specific adenine glycosylase